MISRDIHEISTYLFTLIVWICDIIQLLGRRTFNAFLLCFRALMLMQKRPSEKDCQPHLGLVNPQIADHRRLREVRSSTASKHSRDRFMSVFEYLFNVLFWNFKVSKSIEVVSSYYYSIIIGWFIFDHQLIEMSALIRKNGKRIFFIVIIGNV